MATKYWQLKFTGARTIDEIHAAVGRGGANVVRVHFEGGETHVYLAADEALQQHVADATKPHGPLQEVQAAAVTKLP
jgi:hypothetical protein